MTTLKFNHYDKIQGSFTINSRHIVLVGETADPNGSYLLIDNGIKIYVEGKYEDVSKKVFGNEETAAD